MDAIDVLARAEDALTVQRVFGEPVRQDGVTVIPVARFSGGGGGGSGTNPVPARADGPPDGTAADPEATAGRSGSGGGFGFGVVPAGVYVIREGAVTWRPAVDVNRVVLGGQLVAVAGLLVLRAYLRLRARRS